MADEETIVADDTTATEDTAVEAVEIPAELEGLSEDTVKEVMAEIEGEPETESDEEAQDEQDTEVQESDSYEETSEDADLDSDNKESTEQVLDTPSQRIPYQRFKKQVDKANSLEQELNAYKAKFGALNAPQQSEVRPIQQPVQQVQPVVQQPVVPQSRFSITPEVSAELTKQVGVIAKQMTGLTDDDIDALEYADDDNPDKIRYKYATELAKNQVYSAIQAAARERQESAQRILAYHNKVKSELAEFIRGEQQKGDFAEFEAFAENEYINQVPESERPAYADAYVRCKRGTCSPQDVLLIKQYTTNARAMFDSRKKKAGDTKAVSSRIKAASALPRSQQVKGTAASGTPSVAQLQRMLEETPWEKIPDEYKDILKGIN